MEVLFNAKRYISFLFLPFYFYPLEFSSLLSGSSSVFLFGFILQTVEEKIARHSESGTVTERCLFLCS